MYFEIVSRSVELTNHRPDSVNCTDFGQFRFIFHRTLAKAASRIDILLSFCPNNVESDTSVESIDNVHSLSHPAELSINLQSKKGRKQRKKSHIAPISAKQRVEQLKNPDLYADGENLFCRVCEKSLDHSRKSTITRHFKPEFHIGKKKGGKENSKKTTLKTTLPVKTDARLENLKTISDPVKTFAAANIPSTLQTTLTSEIISRKTFEVADLYPEVML